MPLPSVACLLLALVLAPTLAGSTPRPAAPTEFEIVEATIPAMQAAMRAGRTTSRALVARSLQRIALYEDRVNAIVTVNPRALAEAEALDRERAAGHVRGPLHGIPIAIKDNVHTTDMPTTGGALAFQGFVPPYEATIVSRLRAAGAVILAKTQLTELANWIASGMPTNYNAISGFGFNPYDPRHDPREATGDGRPVLATGGSSSGVGTTLSFWAASIGTETSGSILSPSNQNMLVGIKPTLGRLSRHGIIPITADQDTPGPMARSVTDAALVLGALESDQADPADAATGRCPAPAGRDYTRFLRAEGLRGARIGVPRAFFYDKLTAPGTSEPRGGLNDDQAKAMGEALTALRAAGATVIDPVEIPSVSTTQAADNFLLWSTCAGLDNLKGKDASCSTVFKYGMKRDFNAWLASLGQTAPVHTLTELRLWNVAHQKMGALRYGQAQLDLSDEMDVTLDRARYEADRAKDLRLSAAEGIDAALRTHNLDALLFPGAGGAALAAKPGYPTVIVPFARIPNAPTPPFPNAKPAPFGVSFTGTACSEPRLIELAYAFEQATKKRVPPPDFP